MGDADILAKLSRILETHHLSNDEEENTSIEEILHNISIEAGIRIEDDYNQEINKKQDTEYYEKPTPYEVWKARQEEKFVLKKRDSKKLNEQQWDQLVDHLHRSNKMKESALMKEQNQGLALELNGLSFKPAMNPTSLALAATMKSLKDRLPGMASKREAALSKRREEVQLKEMEECSFVPKREGAKTSEKYLSRMGRSTATPEDFFHYHKEKLRRNDQRKRIIDEIESRELTFKPQLNPKSIKLQEKMLQKNTIIVDPVSRQTKSVQRKYADSETEASTIQPSVGIPEITPRARSYRGKPEESELDVHSRLYAKAVDQIVTSHNKQAEVLQNKLKLSLRPWESAQMSKNQSQYSWTQNKTHHAKIQKGGEDLIDDINKPVAVLEFDDSYGSLWKELRTAQISDEFLQRDMENDEEGRGHAAEL